MGTLDRLERLSQTTVYCEAGVAMRADGQAVREVGLGPAEFFAGIPGTLGGALAMNAGAFGGETWPQVIEVETIDRQRPRAARATGERVPGRLPARGAAGRRTNGSSAPA